MLAHYANFIGLVGVIITLLAYLLLLTNKISSQSVFYSSCNLLGSIFILVSLYYHFNLASTVIEIIWLAISVFGLNKALHKRKRRLAVNLHAEGK